MSFVSGAFLLFLPVTVAVFWLCPAQHRWKVLLGTSMSFCLGWDASCVLLLLLEITLAWIGCNVVERNKNRLLFSLLMVLLFLPLAGYKYSRFLLTAISPALGLNAAQIGLQSYALPVGISFYTFQAVSSVIDVYRNEEKAERSWLRYALFVSFFPQLVAGPIERAAVLMPQLKAQNRFCFDDLCAGTRLVLSGYCQKIYAADMLAPVVDGIFAQPVPDGSLTLLGAVLFSFQIYFDFAGYAAIAMGCARMMGIRLTRNFRSPYAAGSLRDFWRRWHITLSQWFQRYVYRPLGGSRHGMARQMLAAGTVFLLSGLWHGANWTYILWGACHAVCYMIEAFIRHHSHEGLEKGHKALNIAVTFTVVALSWVLFRAESVAKAGAMYRALFSLWHVKEAGALLAMGWPELIALGISAVTAMLAERWAFAESKVLPQAWSVTVGVIMLVSITLCWLAQLSAGGQNAFIYFQF